MLKTVKEIQLGSRKEEHTQPTDRSVFQKECI